METAVFKRFAVQTKIVKTPKNNEDRKITVDEILHPESVKLLEETGKRLVKYAAVTVVAVAVALKTVDTLGEIAVKKTKSADNK